MWSWDNPEHLTKLETAVFAGPVFDLDWGDESKKIIAVGEGSGMMAKCFVWDSGNSAGEMVGHNKRILSCAYKPQRPYRIMTASEDMRTCFYAGPPFKLDHSNNDAHKNFVNCTRYSADGTKIASVGTDKKIQFYDGTTGQPTTEIVDAHAGGIYSCSFSPDGTKLVTASADKTVKMWDVATLTLQTTFNVSADPQVGDMQVAVVWTPGNHIVSLSLNGDLNLLNPDSPSTPARVLQSHQVGITSMCIDLPSSTLFTGSFDGVVCARNLETGVSRKVNGTDKRSLTGGAHSNKVTGMALTELGLVTVGWDDTMKFVANPVAAGSHYGGDSVSLNGQPVAMASSSTGLVAVATVSEVSIYRGNNKVAFITGSALGYTPASIALFGEEEVAVGGDDCKTHIYSFNGSALTPVTTIETRSSVTALAYSPSGDSIAIGDAGRQVEVYERGTWTAKVKGKWVFHTSKITALAWSPNGTFLVSGSQDESIIVWNITKHSARLQIPFAHMSGVSALGWINDAKLVSCGNDHTVVTWKIPQDF